LAEVVVAVILWISLLRLHGSLMPRRFILLGGLAYGVALLTKTTIYASAALLIAAEVGYQLIGQRVEWLRAVPNQFMNLMRAAGKTLLPLFGISLLLSILWFVRNAMVYGVTDLFGWARHDGVVAGQPTTAQWIENNGLRNTVIDLFAISFKSFWAQFGWMGVLVSDRIYVFLFVLTAAASLGALLMVARMWRNRKTMLVEARWTWLLLALLFVLVIAADAYYNLKYFQPQGRYLFYGLISIAAFWSAGLYELLNVRYARFVFALLFVVMLGLDYVCLAWFIVPQLAR
jgi:hypothetical protein